MAKARVVKSVNYLQEDIPRIEQLEKILRREGRDYSDWAREQTADYVKKHGEGNPQSTLDKSIEDPGFVALPTMGEDPRKKDPKKYSRQDLETIAGQADRWSSWARDGLARAGFGEPRDLAHSDWGKRCPHCNEYMPFGLEIHFANRQDCREKAGRGTVS